MPSQGQLSLQARSVSPTRDFPSPKLPRNRSVKAFLPINEDSLISTRGQHLPAILRERSTNQFRRSSIFHLNDDTDVEAGGRSSGEFERLRPPHSRKNSSSLVTDQHEEQRSLDERRFSDAALAVLMSQQMRSMRLIGNSNPRYRWEQYWKTDEELSKMKKPLRKYYERNNSLIQQYVFIDRLLDSSLPHDLIQEYHTVQTTGNAPPLNVPRTISEEPLSMHGNGATSSDTLNSVMNTGSPPTPSGEEGVRVKRTPKNIYKIPDERMPLLGRNSEEYEDLHTPIDTKMPAWEPEDEPDSGDRIVTVAIYINLAANTILLILKIIVTIMTSSVSVLAALVDAVLDFLSTAIVYTTTRLISSQDQYLYPAGRAKLEPIGVLVFSVIMVTSFFQVALEGFNRMTAGGEHVIVQLTLPAIAIMSSTVVIKFLCWLWCRFIKNSSVQALAQDAVTDVVFNIFSIIFPLIGYYANIWWLDPLGGILLSFYVILTWSRTSFTNIRNLSGAAATADERNILLYLTMRFAKTIKQIQGIQAYHAGDKLNVEVDIVLDENTSLRDSHDIGESLQYVLESVPTVDRAFVHLDYAAKNLPTHMRQT